MGVPVIQMPYGRGFIPLEIPQSAPQPFIAQARALAPLADPSAAAIAACEAPDSGAPLADMLGKSANILLVVSDPTRCVAYPQWLPALVKYIRAHMRDNARLRVVMATGTHASPPEGIASGYLDIDGDVIIHDCRDEAALVSLGTSTRGTPFVINKLAVEADLVIATGAVGYHYFAGFTGGVKAIFPGLAGFASVVANHGLCLDLEAQRFAGGVAPGALAGNPVQEDFREVLPQLPPVFIINTVLAEDRDPAFFAAGAPIAAHEACCTFVDAHFRCKLPHPAGLLLLSAGGHPRDISLYQAHKALKHAQGGLAEKARILFFAQCPDGMGHPHFEHWCALSLGETLAELRGGYQPIAHIALSLRTLSHDFEISLVSDLPPEIATQWGLEHIAPENAALAAANMLAHADHPAVALHGSSLLLTSAR
jgi:nickel-dependent lactate racemase